MSRSLSYSVAILFSLLLHIGLVGAMFVDWPSESKRVIMQPQYIEAKLVELAPKKKAPPPKAKQKAKPKPAPKKPKVDLAKKKREEKKRLAKIAAQKKADEKKRLEQERLEQERKEQELRRQQQEAERLRTETEFAEALAAEQALMNAQQDEQAANSYRQLIQQRLSENWSRPPSARRGMETLIRIRLVPTGRVVGVTVLKSSGDSAFDRSVEQAALKAEQFEELQGMEPRLFEKKFRQVDVAFSPEDLRL
ncbi:MAG: cell envelope integrity protein TolA [Porticoccaceae bacterium]|nr:cell envelope integrity protein TolA [Porticoccaceae bacterium]